jgi:ketosteroid isomerase-like protein
MKPVVPLFLLISALFSCTDSHVQQANPAAAAQEKNMQLVRQYYAHFNQHEWQKMAGMYVDTALFKDPSLGEGIVKQTRQETAAKYAQLNQVFPDLHDELVQLYPSGEHHVVVEFVSSGTAADSSTFTLPICTIFEFENGKITKDFTYYDNFGEGE